MDEPAVHQDVREPNTEEQPESTPKESDGDSHLAFYERRDYSRIPFGLNVSRILPDEASAVERHFCVRYYVPRLSDHVKEVRKAGDQLLLIHSNGIVLICLSPLTHPALTDGRRVTGVHFGGGLSDGPDNQKDRLANKVSGRHKHGGQKLKERSVLCKVSCSDGSHFHVLVGVKGKLIEVNERLLTNPELLHTHTATDGFVAIVLSNFQKEKHSLKKEQSLLTADQFEQLVLQRRLDPLVEPEPKRQKQDDGQRDVNVSNECK